MAAPTHPEQMAALIKAALLQNPSTASITIDGVTTNFTNREALIRELAVWESKVARAKGRRRMFRSVDFGAAMPDRIE